MRALFLSFGLLLTALAIFLGVQGVREQDLLARLRTDGVRVVGTIVNVDTERRQVSGEGRRVTETWRLARVRYTIGGVDHEPVNRHTLSGTHAALGVGDPFPLVVLADVPDRPYAPDAIAGARFAAYAMPVLFGLLAILSFAVGYAI